MKWKIGKIEIKNQVVLAPMAGISNPSYIKIASELGVGLAFTELISSEAIVRNNKKTLAMLDNIESLDIPVGVQIFGSNPSTMARAARIIEEKKNVKIIDINMGCPVNKVALKNNAGSALLKDPDLVYEIVSKVVESVNCEVTVKIRSGWNEESKNAVLIAKTIEKAGASAITIHGRTRSAGYSGNVDLDIIKKVVESVNIPVIGNGDIKCAMDAKKMIEVTGCSAVMIGRSLIGNPWLIKECVSFLDNNELIDKPSYKDRLDMIKKHLNYLIIDKGEKLGILEFRGQLMNYLKTLPNNKEVKVKLCKAKNKNEFLEILDEYEKNLENT